MAPSKIELRVMPFTQITDLKIISIKGKSTDVTVPRIFPRVYIENFPKVRAERDLSDFALSLSM